MLVEVARILDQGGLRGFAFVLVGENASTDYAKRRRAAREATVSTT